MNTAARRLRRLSRWTIKLLALGVILFAALIGLVNLALPLVSRYPDAVLERLSKSLGMQIRAAELSGEWGVRGPVLRMREVTLMPSGAATPIRLAQAELAIDFYAFASRASQWSEFTVVGVDLTITRDTSGQWQIASPAPGRKRNGGGDWLFALGGVSLRDARVSIDDRILDRRMQVIASARLSAADGMQKLSATLALDAQDRNPLRLAAEFQPGTEGMRGRVYLIGNGLPLQRWLGHAPIPGIDVIEGTADLEVWGFLAAGRVNQLQARFGLQSLVLGAHAPLDLGDAGSIVPQVAYDSLSGFLRLDRDQDVSLWRLQELDVAREGRASSRMTASLWQRAGKSELQASGVELDAFAPLVAFFERVPVPARRFAYLSSPRGRVEQLIASGSGKDDFRIDAQLDGWRWNAVERIPGVRGLRASLSADPQAVSLALDSPLATVDLRGVMRAPIDLTGLSGWVGASRLEQGWRVEAHDLKLRGDGFDAIAAGGIELLPDAPGPLLDLYLTVLQGRVDRARLFWPVNKLKPRTLQWLDRALVAGTVESGRLVVRGHTGNWPFSENEGRFEATAEVRGAQLDFHEDWPVATGIDARADFINRGMTIQADGLRTRDLQILSARAHIPEFKEPVMSLVANGQGSGAGMLDYLDHTPIAERHGTHLLGLQIDGRGDFDVDMRLPLRGAAGKPRVRGQVQLQASRMADAKWGLEFTDVAGTVEFGRDGVRTRALAVGVAGHPAQLDLALGELTGDPRMIASARLYGRFPAQKLFANDAIAPLLAEIRGASEWDVVLDIEREVEGQPASRGLSARSDLVGTEISLPPPLSKPAAQRMPLKLSVDLPAINGAIALELGELATLRGRLPGPDQEFHGVLRFGSGEIAELPARGLRIEGRAHSIDSGAWMALGSSLAGDEGGGAVAGVALQVERLYALGADLGPTRLDAQPIDKGWRVQLDGERAAGQIDLIEGAQGALDLRADLQRLHWPEGLRNEALQPIAPALIPALHLWIADLRWGELRLGDARLESYPEGNGMNVELLETRGAELAINAKGQWVLDTDGERSKFQLSLAAEDLGVLLDRIGMSGLIDGGVLFAMLDAGWRGSPARLELAHVDGVLDLNLSNGRFLDVEPGAGRFLGLMSVLELPRRLTLDFSDFFREGLSFNTITARFEIREGSAMTEDLSLRSPAAQILMRGRTGLVARDYDQEITVLPGVSNTLPVLGAAAAGPVGVAAGLIMQGVLDNPLRNMAGKRYHLGGTWDEPLVEEIPGPLPARPRRDRSTREEPRS